MKIRYRKIWADIGPRKTEAGINLYYSRTGALWRDLSQSSSVPL